MSPAAPSSVPSSWPIPSEGTTFTSALTSQAQPGLPKPSLHLESSASAQPLHRCSLGQGHHDLLLNPYCIRPQGLRVLLTIPACSPLTNTSAALLRTHRGSQGLLPARHLLPCYPSSPRPWLWDPLPRATTPHLQRLQEPELLAAKALFISHPLHQSQQSETPKLPASVGPQLLPWQHPHPSRLSHPHLLVGKPGVSPAPFPTLPASLLPPPWEHRGLLHFTGEAQMSGSHALAPAGLGKESKAPRLSCLQYFNYWRRGGGAVTRL